MVMSKHNEDIFSQVIKWELTDIKTDSQLFSDQELDSELSENQTKPLLCQWCNLEFFSHTQFLHHHIQHVTLPSVSVQVLDSRLTSCLLAGNIVKKRPGPKSKTEQVHSPIKLTFKRLQSCREPAFKVVFKKKDLLKDSSEMDDMIPEGRGLEGTHMQTPSPTPSDILRPEVNMDSHRSTWESLALSFGFLAPEAMDTPSTVLQEAGGGGGGEVDAPPEVNGDSTPDLVGKEVDSGASTTSEPEPSASPLPPPPPPALPLENGTFETDTEHEIQKSVEQESSDSGCEKDVESEKDFTSSEQNPDATSTLTPPPANPSPTIGGLTIKCPSMLNSSVLNGSLSLEPKNGIATLTSSEVGDLTPAPRPLTVLSPAALGATDGGVNLLNLVALPPLETCEVCGDRNENMEQHRAAMGHYKCHVSPDCAVVLFTSAAELRNHQHVTHGISPPPPPASPQQSLQQLQQQVQRLPLPFGMPVGVMTVPTPPPPVSPGYRLPGSITLTQGGIQARPFAMQTSPSTMRSDGSPISSPALPTGLGRSISISPSTKAPTKRAASPPTVDTVKRTRPESPDCELVDVQKMPSLPSSISLTPMNRGGNTAPTNKESSGVANILASRGITVTPAANRAAPAAPPARASTKAAPVTTLNLSSAVSIVPATQSRNQFAVPQGRSRQPERNTSRPTTCVDLTQDTPPSFSRRNRPQRFTCQVCDKVFTTQETLNQHLTSHRSPGKLPYKCNLCAAQYPTQQGLLQHKQTYHKEAQGSEMALPVVDMKHPGTIQKLASLGIRHCLVLSQLTNSSGGVFGLPIVAIDNARNPAVCNLGALGASNVLSLGPAKALR